jgi:hypothetical protein
VALRDALGTTGRLSALRALLVGAVVLVLLAAASGALLLDHPAAQVGVGRTDWSAFSTVEEGAYTVSIEERRPAGDGTRGFETRYGQFENGSYVERVERTDSDRSLRQYETVAEETVQLDGTRYERERLVEGHAPETLVPDVYVDDRGRVVRVETASANGVGSNDAAGVEAALAELAYARAGTARWNGTTLLRYDVLGHRDPVERLTARERVTGYVLVDDRGRLRYADLGLEGSPSATLRYRAYPGRAPTVPGWVGTARSVLGSPASAPNVTAYRRGSTVLLTSTEQWTPDRPATVAVLDRNGEDVSRARLPAGEPLFERRGNGTYVASLTPTTDGLVVAANASSVAGDEDATPGRVVVDRRGRNLLDVPVGPSGRLGSVYSVTAAHLRPENGGGRVLRVDDLQFGTAVEPDTPVTLAVENGTTSRSLTVPARELSSDRFYLSRTPDGLAFRNSGGIAAHVSPAAGFAERRFVANATLTVTVHGIPVVEKPVPERATQASETPLSELLTGVAIQLYDEPPDGALLGQGERLRAMNWTGYTFVKVHSWDYDALHVSGGFDVFHPDVVREDRTAYYRASDGARFRVETANGTRLFEGTADGTRTVSP